MKRFASKVSDGKATPWTQTELQNFFIELINNSQLPSIVIVIDALDEGDEDDVRQTVGFLVRWQRYAKMAACSLRVALSSRHYPNITIERSLSLTLENHTEHHQDIILFVQTELAHIDEPQCNKLKSRICHRADGVFLWVVLVLPSLKKAFDKGKSFTDMARRLEETPADLHDIFDQIISRDSEDSEECSRLLAWVLFSMQPLSPIELYCAIHQTSPDSIFGNVSTVAEGAVARYLLNCSRGLVEVTQGTFAVVQLIHETIRDYLTRNKSYSSQQAGQSSPPNFLPALEPHLCHTIIAEGCLHYLHHLRDNAPVAEEMSDGYPLADYAAEHWWRHLRISNQPCDEKLVHLAIKLLTEADSVSKWVQPCGIRNPLGDELAASSQVVPPWEAGGWLPYDDFCQAEVEKQERGEVDEQMLIVPPLYFAASVGLPELVNKMLVLGIDVNAAGGPCGYPVIAAARYADQNVVRILADHGADLNAQGGVYGNALQAASCRGHAEIVQMLLGRSVDVNAIGGRYRTALRAATSMCRETIVRMLLEHGARVDDPAEYYNSLQKAAYLGDVNTARLLLSHGADIHKRGRFGNALTLAIKNGHIDMVRLLLEHGAGSDDQGNLGCSALHAACYMGFEPAVRLLLEYGADRNAKGANYDNALQAAIEGENEKASVSGHTKIKDVLLDYFPEPIKR